jgi:hypothetical protein
VPFVAAAYGLLYGRLDVEVTRPRIRFARLPKAKKRSRNAPNDVAEAVLG